MISKENFSLNHIKELEKESNAQVTIIEKSMFAFAVTRPKWNDLLSSSKFSDYVPSH